MITSSPFPHLIFWKRVTPLFILICMMMAIVTFLSTNVPATLAGGINCGDTSWLVGNESDLNAAITCFNNKTTSGEYSISFSQNISLTVSSEFIFNENNPGATLLLEGNKYILDGQFIPGVGSLVIGPTNTVTIQNITIINANMTGPGDTGANGGGIANLGTLTVTNSTIAQNRANAGGGIFNLDGILTIINSTIAGNSSLDGGAIYNYGIVTISDSTIADNLAYNIGSSIYNNTGTVIVNNSIIANENSDNCYGTISSGGHNLVNDNSCNFAETGDLSNTAPLYTPFIDSNNNWVYALLPSSPAIDNGNSSLSTDQRGISRPQGAADDIGAFESQGFVLTANANIVALSATASTSQKTLINTPFPNPLSLTVGSTDDEPVVGGVITFSAPASGASVTFTETVVTIATNGTVSLLVTANGTAGSYEVTADTPGNTGEPLVYYLTNSPYTTFLPMIVSDDTNDP